MVGWKGKHGSGGSLPLSQAVAVSLRASRGPLGFAQKDHSLPSYLLLTLLPGTCWKLYLVACARSAARTACSVASEIYDFLFDESFAWEMVHAVSVRAGIPKWLSWMILSGATASVAYYLIVVRKLARVYVKAKSQAAQITERMGSILTTPYSPTPWAFNRHLTTILGSEIRSKPDMTIHRCDCVLLLQRVRFHLRTPQF